MKILIDSKTYLAIGGELAKVLEQRINAHDTIRDAFAASIDIAQSVTDDPQKQDCIIDFIGAEARRAGIPTSKEGQELLAAAEAQKQVNADVAAETRWEVLKQEYIANMMQRDQPRTGPEQEAWEKENARIRRATSEEFGPDALEQFKDAFRDALPPHER